MHFEFRNWRKAKEAFLINKENFDGHLQFVISTHPYTSGYYIESLGMTLIDTDRVIKTNKSVSNFFRRIEKTIKENPGSYRS